MAKVLNTFTQGVMNKGLDKSIVPQDFFIDSENLRFSTSINQDGVGRKIKGTVLVSDSTDGSEQYKCISAKFNKKKNAIIYFLASTTGSHSKIVEYNIDTKTTKDIAKDDTGILNFNQDDYITGVDVIDDLLIFSEWGNNVRCLNIEEFKTLPINGFTEEDIKLIEKPPHNKPKITLQETTSDTNQENYLESKFLSFAYRWRYKNGGYSPLSPFSLAAFRPDVFDYDFAVQTNKSMINKFNQVLLEFNTGSKNVVEIQLVFKNSQDNEVFIINDFVKESLGWGDNQTESFVFNNFNSIRALGKNELARRFDNVPRSAKAQVVINGRLLLSNYKEKYNMIDEQGDIVTPDYAISIDSTAIPSLIPAPTVKSYRDYDVAIEYLDEDLRPTPLFKSLTSTIFVPNNLSVMQNKLEVTLKNKPPAFAKYFRFFINQSKRGYEQVLPTNFYEDGVYVWVKLESADIDKIRKGDYLIVKTDSEGNLNITKKTKVLELERKEKNFLETDDSITEVRQIPGTYYKIKPEGFRLNLDDLDTFESIIDKSKGNWIWENWSDAKNVIYDPIFYGEGEDDLSSSGTYTGATDERYQIIIDSVGDGSTTYDTFKWQKIQGTSEADNINITPGVPILLENGVSITFASDTGHTLNDRWVVSAKSAQEHNDDKKAYGNYSSIPDETIYGGASITIIYDEYNEETQYVERTFIASKNYHNLEEWFYEDSIDVEFSNAGIDSGRFAFRRGAMVNTLVDISADGSGYTCMIIQSKGIKNNFADKDPKVKATINIKQSQNNIVLETEPKDQSSSIFHEIGKTYEIQDGYHKGDGVGDVDQSESQDLKVVLDWHNAFAYGNSVESYKIKDEFNSPALDTGSRASSTSKEKYKEVVRTEDITWSDIYNAEASFNGLNAFNLSLSNFISLDRENGPIHRILSRNNDVIVFQEDSIGRLPYNKNIIYTGEGDAVVRVATNILDRKSYSSYGAGKHGCTSPEGIVSDGFRIYFPDKQRGVLLRLSNDGITPINENHFDLEFSQMMDNNFNNKLIGGFDPKNKEYLLHLPDKEQLLAFKENPKGFPTKYLFSPDFMLRANNEIYSWKNGVMYQNNASDKYNTFYGEEKKSKITFLVNHHFAFEKLFKAIGIYSTHPWLVKLKTSLTSREIPLDSFRQINNHWFSEIMGNTNEDFVNNNIFGIGSYPVNLGVINTQQIPASISVGDIISDGSEIFGQQVVESISGNKITLVNKTITRPKSFLFYKKNQNIDGVNIKGDFMEVELTSSGDELVEIKSVKTEIDVINTN